jgi:hypothetical protein
MTPPGIWVALFKLNTNELTRAMITGPMKAATLEKTVYKPKNSLALSFGTIFQKYERDKD